MPKILILVPTEMEFRMLQPQVAAMRCGDAVSMAICGFGPIAAAAQSAILVAQHQPQRVVLVGIAGALSEELPIGSACSFQRVACYGVGAGTGRDHLPAGRIGWKHWVPSDRRPEQTDSGEIGDELPLETSLSSDGSSRLLLTCCAASASETDVCERRQQSPDAVAEDMEGFGVAVACHMSGVSLNIVRGISNRAGDRVQSGWMIRESLAAAGAQLRLQLSLSVSGIA